MFTVMSLVAPMGLTKLVPVTVSMLVAPSKVALVMVGAVTLDTVTALPIKSAVDVLVRFQFAAALKLNVVVSTA